jgi:DNA-binding MarR family transcriptional regulator
VNFYQRLGFLVLGSRLRRLSESFLSGINRVYAAKGIEFDASWFPVFFLLSEHEELSIKELSDETGVSHPAASQLISGLKKRGLVKTKTSRDDGRKQLITLTPKGTELLGQVQPVWQAILLTMGEFAGSEEEGLHLLKAMGVFEQAFQKVSLPDAILENLNLTHHG